MSAHLFSMTPKVEIPRSSFSMPFTHKTTCDAGKLIPIFFKDVIPGDTFNLKTNIFCRMATLISPIMDDLYLNTFYFFVPYRLVWNNFQKFMGEQIDPSDSIDFVIPQTFTRSGNEVECQSVCDYFGLPLGNFYGNGSNNIDFSSLPLRAYYLIWNEWFRSENLQDSVPVLKNDSNGVFSVNYSALPNGFKGPNIADSCLPIGKIHDYFTSALPWVLKDGTAVDVPLGGSAPVTGIEAFGENSFTVAGFPSGKTLANITPLDNSAGYPAYPNDASANNVRTIAFDESKIMSAESNLVADLSQVYALTVNTLRESFQVQRFLERAARSGTRYTEILRGFFGVVSPDARLQRPEYLGGTTSRLQVNVVPQTSASDSNTPQANLAAFVTGTNSNRDGFTKSFVEHGMLIGLMAIRGPLLYQQGIPRYWSKKTRFDFYWPTFAHLGEQAILNKEIYAQGTADDNGVFGYAERYAEYRYSPSYITGKFRSTYAQSLDNWHLGQKFDSLPTLSNEFIQDKQPIDRVIAVPSEPQFLVDIHFDLKCARPMPLYGVPGLIDHF